MNTFYPVLFLHGSLFFALLFARYSKNDYIARRRAEIELDRIINRFNNR